MRNGLRGVAAVAALAAVLALAGCAKEEAGPSEKPTGTEAGAEVELRIDVADTDWQGETFSVTRSGETLEGLKATSGVLPDGEAVGSSAYGYGFSLHGSGLLGSDDVRRQVTWNASTGQWNAGERIYWKRTTGSETFGVYAYAPYKTTTYPVTAGVLTFTSADYASGGSNPDLLYAGASVKRSDGLAQLTFRHALAKMTLGTITNNSGAAMTLTEVSVSGNLYAQGDLNLSDGTWSNFKYFSGDSENPYTTTVTSKDLVMPVSTILGSTLEIPNGESRTISNLGSLLLIPGPTVTASLTFVGGASFSFTTTLEQGKAMTFNMTVGKNFEVIIE